MKLLAARGARRLCMAGACALAGAGAWAQSPPLVAPYVDRVLDPGPQQAGPADERQEDSSGWPRGWSAEFQSSRQDTGGYATRNSTLLFSGYVDTPDYGSISANANLNRYTQALTGWALVNGNDGTGTLTATPFSYNSSNTWRIDQRGMPFDGGWYANNSLGNINMAAAALSRGIGRVALPALPIDGASLTVERPGSGTSFNVSGGRLGYFDGLLSQGFAIARGNAFGAGAQTQLHDGPCTARSGAAEAAVQFVEARGFNANGITGYAQDTRSLWAAVSWQGLAPWAKVVEPGYGGPVERVGGLRVQANAAHSAGQPSDALSLAPRDSASGLWVDAAWRTQWLRQSASAFYFERALRWGTDPLPSDLRGVAWAGDIATQQWQLGANFELSDSVSGLRRGSMFGNAFGRYRFDSRNAITSTLAARTGDYAAQSLEVSWERLGDWGRTQWRNDLALGPNSRTLRSNIDHAWDIGESHVLSTSLGIDDTAAGSSWRGRAVDWAVLGSMPFVWGSRLDLNLRGTQGIGGNPLRFLNADARLRWPLALGWSFIAQLSAARGQAPVDPMVVSALTAATMAPVLVMPSNRAFLIALRYEGRAGTATAPIGGGAGAGAGRLEGSVYFDQDANGRREAGEGGVAGVTVLLDRRYVARTDAQGRYYFPAVAAGTHEIELVPDNLPLPWALPPQERIRRIDLFVRGTSIGDFAVQRQQ